MQQPIAGLWQLSPLTDLFVPQGDIEFPAPLSDILPDYLSEAEIAAQEWHLMHDIELTEAQLQYPVINLIVGGVDYFAEIRINGEAVLDCDGSEISYRKEVKRYLNPGRNRLEILFLEQDEDDLLGGEEDLCLLTDKLPRKRETRLGIWELPVLQFVRHVSLDYISTEQIWHHGGGCEFKVDLFYQLYYPGLVSATVKFNGTRYQMPLDTRSGQTSALFQVEAPKITAEGNPEYYLLEVELDGQRQTHQIALNPNRNAEHFPV
ncbi:glycosyl hydrolase 2 galactose-binding domain-containing protein [Vibrio sp. SCSIO 43137]|uniref:glycosyl hydrolase 2 galactose-binding domain-containing protein n=1 Tax=Vibrio sp. SCSIO 43137 TaxID=3021011 RepID=UPI002307F63D|nr:hypothetical protein [Vibrio sp. SCSIO 43137]WCE30052.1 hypothetical protein PK654_01750 [Vibrio sp. SCSIO 43137]